MSITISIISGSVREGRKSHSVALYFEKYLKERNVGTIRLIDLKEYDFPIFSERLQYQNPPMEKALQFAEEIKKSDGIILVTPEYNGGYPSSVKNAIDLLYPEWHRKPIAISTVSGGSFAGTQAITSLQFSLWKIRAWTVPAMFPVPSVQNNFDEFGNPKEKESTDKRAASFINELLWCIEANNKMK